MGWEFLKPEFQHYQSDGTFLFSAFKVTTDALVWSISYVVSAVHRRLVSVFWVTTVTRLVMFFLSVRLPLFLHFLYFSFIFFF